MYLRIHKMKRQNLLPRPLYWGVTLLGVLWALPLTLIGIALALPTIVCRGHLYLVRESTPALLVSGPFADYLLARHPFGAMSAMAIGHIVIADRQALTKQILTHELADVGQAARWHPARGPRCGAGMPTGTTFLKLRRAMPKSTASRSSVRRVPAIPFSPSRAQVRQVRPMHHRYAHDRLQHPRHRQHRY